MNARVTVLLPIYNETEEYVERSIDSILTQTFTDFELLVYLDNPKNETLIKYMGNKINTDARIRFRINENNIGLPATLNRMINEVTTEYIARMDADDIAIKDRLQKQYEYMTANKDCDLCGTNILYINTSGDKLKNNGNIPEDSAMIADCLKYKNVMSHPTYFAKTSVMKAVLYREKLRYAQDYDFVCRCVELGYKLANINDIYLQYRVGNVSSNKLMRQNMTAYFIKHLYRENKLCFTENIDELIQKEIDKYGEEPLSVASSYRCLCKGIFSSIKSLKFARAIQLVKFLIFPHPYRRDSMLSERKYKRIMIGHMNEWARESK